MRPLVVSVFAAAVLTAAQSPEPTGSISGKVMDAVTNLPLAGVKITVNFSGPPNLSQDDGSFALSKLEPRDHQIKVERDGYATLDGLHMPTVRLRAGQTVTGFIIRLAPEATLAGRVVDAGGKPLESHVIIRQAGPYASHVAFQPAPGGVFSVRGLRAGNYSICARASRGVNNQETCYP
ncbi:MAG: carboxypeptidase regulatory-like domain-containing protein, partial [Bryobacterales bacterium]|nr:carboxypeptidase regulatory-like domain-containing protein [Bryobacterales bacterium]